MSKLTANQRSPSMVTESSRAVTPAAVDVASGSKTSRGTGKLHGFGKRDHAIKRNLNIPVVVRGWLYKQINHIPHRHTCYHMASWRQQASMTYVSLIFLLFVNL
ncbi:hypothetical protein XENOCAPTIV_006805 [Xenoophorus captivus]|uniref:Uncharacterized protein n=1 Tax=Xenoophorus captivus TaxID=1517983 RepID=A0ABV0Q4K0_9TELE